jgi:hypothetical protein
MPEYLAPGVFVEEQPGPKSIQRASTSTAGFVGMTQRGPVVGPPILVTSYGDFARVFGGFISVRDSDLGEQGHLPLAVKQFFDQGGSRAFVSRVYRVKGQNLDEDHRQFTLSSGVVTRLRANAPVTSQNAGGPPQTLLVASLRGFNAGASLLFREPGVQTAVQWQNARPATGRVELVNGLTPADGPHRTDTAFVQLVAPAAGAPNNLPITACEPGQWAEGVRIDVRPRTGAPTEQIGAAAAAAVAGRSDLSVQSAAAFHPGAVIELRVVNAQGVLQAPATYATVFSVTGNTVQVFDPAAGLPAPAANMRIEVSLCEIDVLVSFGASVEIHTGTWRFVDPLTAAPATSPELPNEEVAAAFNRRSVWFRLNRDSRVVRTVETDHRSATYNANAFPAYAANDPLATHPTTPTGQPIALAAQGNTAGPDSLPTLPDYLGDPAAGPGERSGIESLRDEDGISVIAAPGIISPDVQAALINHAEAMKYRFAVLDGPRTADIAAIRAHRSNFDSTYAALYYPWIETPDPRTGEVIAIPPSGPTIGIYARSDIRVGVHKAPANETVDLARNLLTKVSTGEQEVLNPEGINAIRDFRDANRGIRVWGARTLSSDPEWKYVNVRRLFLMVEHSIYRSTQWVVFEPNGDELWARVRSTVETFLEQIWREGMLLGRKKDEAFFVRCDRSTMSQDDLDAGRLICLIGIAPVKPAEFVIFRIGQFTADRPN